jgi:hypothetical protein
MSLGRWQLLAFLAVLCGSSFLIVKTAPAEVPPTPIVLVRVGLVTAALRPVTMPVVDAWLLQSRRV